MQRSDSQEFCQLLSYKDDVDLEAKLDEWEHFYNVARSNGAFNGKRLTRRSTKSYNHPARCPVSNRWLHLGQLLDGLPLPLRDLVRMQLGLDRQLRNRALPADRLKCNLGLELGRKPSARLDRGSSLSRVNPP
jgi:hypothetical protein